MQRPGDLRTARFLACAVVLANGACWLAVWPASAQSDAGARSGGTASLLRINVIGDDDRRIAASDEADLTDAVGLITCERNDESGRHFSRATATLVGSRRTVLTAAHVFRSGGRRSGLAVEFDAIGDCRFSRFDAGGILVSETGFVAAAYGAYRRNSGLPTEDWAVLRTAEPQAEPARPLRFAALDFEGLADGARYPIATVAYHADQRMRRRVPLLSVGHMFTINYAGFRRLAHTADMGRMSSGAAIVYQAADGASVVLGVHRSAANFGDYNLAVPVTGALATALNSFVDGRVPDSSQLAAVMAPTTRPALAYPVGDRRPFR